MRLLPASRARLAAPLLASVLASIPFVGGCPAPEAPPAAAPAPAGAGATYSYSLMINAENLYPAATWLPAAYKADYPSLSATIKHFTEQSLARDGIAGATVTVVELTQRIAILAIAGSDPAIKGYGTMHPAFVNALHSGQALAGVQACMSTPGCWCTDPNGCHSGSGGAEPWALFLPLGLPMVNQKAVLFLDYPPAASLMQANPDGSHGDYLLNWTMCRWHNLMTNAGAAQPDLFETIVDARPIAAAGSKLTTPLPDATKYFDSPGNYYITPMVDLLANPPSNPSHQNHSLPVTALGSPARGAWTNIAKQQVNVLSVGTTPFPSGRTTPWIGGNHPDVTTYQCCAGDTSCGTDQPTNQCINMTSSMNHDLIACEVVDFTVACFLQALGQNPDLDVTQAEQACNQRWLSPQGNDKHAFCIQAKLDNQDRNAQCRTYADADAYCRNNGENPCATLTCPPAAAATPQVGAPESAPPLTCTQMAQGGGAGGPGAR